MYFKAFALTGRIADCLYTQGVALGYGLLPFQGVLLWASALSGRAAVGFLTFWAFAYMGFLTFWVCCYGLLDLQGVVAYMGFCPLPLLYPSASDFQFRYAPVTVGSGRDALTSPKLFRPV